MDESVEFTDVEAEARAIAGMSGEADDEQAVAQVRQRLLELEGLPLIDAIMNISPITALPCRSTMTGRLTKSLAMMNTACRPDAC